MNEAASGPANLARRWSTLTPEQIDTRIRKRLTAKHHASRLRVELDFNARLVTCLREERLWPRR